MKLPDDIHEPVQATRFGHDLPRPSLLTISNAFVRSANVE